MPTPAEDATVVSVDRLEISYGDRPALKGVSLHLRRGEIYALLGPNGAGKTSLVRAIAGRVIPAGGQVRVTGQDPATSRTARAGIGLVPQQIALYPNLSCAENLRAFGRLLGVPRERVKERVADVLAAIGLADRADDLCADLSGGMQRRLNIGAAILHAPDLLVLDEPTVGVDLHAKEDIHDLLRSLSADGMAILITTHDMEQAAAIADRVGIIDAGEIVNEGAPAALVAEAFGDSREILITLAAQPAPGVRDLLLDLGLTSVRGGLTWAGRLTGDYEAVSDVEARLRAAGGAPREISLRQPSLTSVVLQATGAELS